MLRWAGLVCAMLTQAAAADPLPAPVTDADFRPVAAELVPVGRLLFYDPLLSGNRNIACATCHHPRFGTSDGVALSLGEGGIGLGPERRVDPANPPEERVPRNAQSLFNLGALEYSSLFHDGRIELDAARPSGLRTPMEDDMVTGFDSLLAAQTMFPVVSPDEMAGQYSENEIARAVRLGILTGEGGAWDLITARVRAIPAYAAAFAAAVPEIAAGRPVAFTDISNAVAAFMEVEFRSDTSPFDAHLRGERPLTGAAARGMDLFYGAAGCSGCHAGKFQTDHGFHAMGVPQFGPGKVARYEAGARDEGRMRVTGRAEDLFAFRTPALRNVARTAPFGHDGAYPDLRGFLEAHLEPAAAGARYDRTMARMPALESDLESAKLWAVLESPDEVAAIARAAKPGRVILSEAQIGDLIAFLDSLTDEAALAGRLGIPEAVPSGLPVEQ